MEEQWETTKGMQRCSSKDRDVLNYLRLNNSWGMERRRTVSARRLLTNVPRQTDQSPKGTDCRKHSKMPMWQLVQKWILREPRVKHGYFTCIVVRVRSLKGWNRKGIRARTEALKISRVLQVGRVSKTAMCVFLFARGELVNMLIMLLGWTGELLGRF